MIKLLLVDDHTLVRTGVGHILSAVSDFQVVGELQSGEEAIQWCRSGKSVDVILMDISLPEMTGLEATQKLRRLLPEIHVIILTMHASSLVAHKTLQAGAAGFLGKGASAEEMVHAIRMAVHGKRYISPTIAQTLVLDKLHYPDPMNPFTALSDREWQVMLRVAQGRKVAEIAKVLCLSQKTVNSYRYRIFAKLKVGGDVALAKLALQAGLLYYESALDYPSTSGKIRAPENA